MAKTIDFKAKKVKTFSTWLKKFSSIENSLLLEIDEGRKCFVAKSYNEEKSVVKYSSILFSDAGFSVQKSGSGSRFLKVGIYNISRIIKSLDHFSGSEFSISFQYEEVGEKDSKNLAGIFILIKGGSLKMRIDCTSLSIFKYISDDMFKNHIAETNPLREFSLSNQNIEKINSLSELDRDYKFLEFLSDKERIHVRGLSFDLEIEKSEADKGHDISIYKDQFSKIDLENYKVILGDDKIVFYSMDSDTTIVTSMVVKDEKYEDQSMDF